MSCPSVRRLRARARRGSTLSTPPRQCGRHRERPVASAAVRQPPALGRHGAPQHLGGESRGEWGELQERWSVEAEEEGLEVGEHVVVGGGAR